ncbi:peptidogalycan biosysnthesis protein [Psychrobacter sp. CAL346-MNA-CIBAN-0220]|uniref:GNAT family N-acetyltransferase n=1 Tax=Psychrobacter sp. CAL346-MNA-CIBAN-0220 TaxID=3140457 RepID=UPI00332EF461
MSLQYALVSDMSWQKRAEWQTPDTPFMSFAFWQALSDTGAIGERAGWLPIFVLVYRQNEVDTEMQPIAVMPVFVKGHHQGEFVFDHSWAEAYARYGIDYYPRLVTSSPYTPITGQRLWLTVGEQLSAEIINTAIAGVDDIAQQVGASSWHALFVTPELANLTASIADDIDKAIENSMVELSSDNTASHNSALLILERQGCQFLWQNKNLAEGGQPFADFDDFLMTLKAKKRKTIRAERRKVAMQGIHCQRKCGDDITEADWKAFYHCYVMTYAVRGQQPYLSIDFFMALAKSMPEHLMLAQALDSSGEIIASSLFLYDVPNQPEPAKDLPTTTLYGRYWGALGEYDSLHFELCYYQGLEFAIEQGLTYFDPGTQGEHKLIRGFIPTKTHSLHRIYDPRFVPAIANFCSEDRMRMAQYRQQAHEALPFNVDNMPEFLS